MNANEALPIDGWDFALKIANHMAARTGVRRRVRQAGTIWIVHEVDQPVTIRKTNTEEI